MTERRPFSRSDQGLDTGLDTGEARPDLPVPADGLRETATDPPAVVPTMTSEQTVVAAGMGLSSFAKADPEGGLTGADDDPAEDDGTVSEGDR
jgi:hypothetical protein